GRASGPRFLPRRAPPRRGAEGADRRSHRVRPEPRSHRTFRAHRGTLGGGGAGGLREAAMTPAVDQLLADSFRQAMRRVAATVNVISICVEGRPMGITATAVSSVSMSPPSLLVCINQAASLHEPMA